MFTTFLASVIAWSMIVFSADANSATYQFNDGTYGIHHGPPVKWVPSSDFIDACDAAVVGIDIVIRKHGSPALAHYCVEVSKWACGVGRGFAVDRPDQSVIDRCNELRTSKTLKYRSSERIFYRSAETNEGIHVVNIDQPTEGRFILRDYTVNVSVARDVIHEENQLESCSTSYLPCRLVIVKQPEDDPGYIGCLRGGRFKDVDGVEFTLSEYVIGLQPYAERDGDYSRINCEMQSAEPFFIVLTPILRGGE